MHEVYPMAKADRKLTCFAKRHYEAIAEAMQEARTHLRCDAINQHECVIGMLADMFAAITLNSNVSVSLMRASPVRT